MKCHHCAVELPSKGRPTTSMFPTCGAPDCKRSSGRNHMARRRARVRIDVDVLNEILAAVQRIEQRLRTLP
jgi:hypothetical protein